MSLGALSAIMDKHRMARVATLSTVAIFVDSRRGNDLTWQAAGDDPRLLPVATADPRGGPRCAGEIAERLEQGGKLAALFPEVQGWPLEHGGCAEVLRVAGQAGAPVLIEAGRPGAPTQIARLAEACSARVILSGVGYRTLGEALMVMKAHPHVYLETHLLTSADGIERVVDEIGSDRLLFGSRAPLLYFSSAYLRLRFADIGVADRDAVLAGNFSRLLEGA